MVFSSLFFIYAFLPVTLFLYFIYKGKAYRNYILIISSLIFYAWGEPVWVLLLVLTTWIDYFAAKIIDQYKGLRQSKAALSCAVVSNLLILFYFKYSGFTVENLNHLLGSNIHILEFSLPIGISFYTFQALSYVIDVYRGEVEVQKSFHKLLLYVALFPQLVAGPIVRYRDIAEEIENRSMSLTAVSEGAARFMIGLAKKAIIANTAGNLASSFLQSESGQFTVLGAWFGILLFAIQIYYDFSGYSDMAIGLGKIFGFTYKENFNYPYISKSAAEFWRRWHISLGSFFRDYVYIPLGGKYQFQMRNIIVVWFLTGLWHGASWNFIFWGLYYGFFIILEKYLLNKWLQHTFLLSRIYFIFLTLIGWSIFYYTDLTQWLGFMKAFWGLGGVTFSNTELTIQVSNYYLFVILAVIGCTPVVKQINHYISKKLEHHRKIYGFYEGMAKPILNAGFLLVSTALLVGQTYNPFLYFRF